VGDIQEELRLDLKIEPPAIENQARDQDDLHDNDDNEQGKEQLEHLHNMGGVILFGLQSHHGGLNGVQLESSGDQSIQLGKDVGHEIICILIRELKGERERVKKGFIEKKKNQKESRRRMKDEEEEEELTALLTISWATT
jgi:hypothetical protein